MWPPPEAVRDQLRVNRPARRCLPNCRPARGAQGCLRPFQFSLPNLELEHLKTVLRVLTEVVNNSEMLMLGLPWWLRQ